MANVDNFINGLKQTLISGGSPLTKFKNPVHMVMEGLNRLNENKFEEVSAFNVKT